MRKILIALLILGCILPSVTRAADQMRLEKAYADWVRVLDRDLWVTKLYAPEIHEKTKRAVRYGLENGLSQEMMRANIQRGTFELLAKYLPYASLEAIDQYFNAVLKTLKGSQCAATITAFSVLPIKLVGLNNRDAHAESMLLEQIIHSYDEANATQLDGVDLDELFTGIFERLEADHSEEAFAGSFDTTSDPSITPLQRCQVYRGFLESLVGLEREKRDIVLRNLIAMGIEDEQVLFNIANRTLPRNYGTWQVENGIYRDESHSWETGRSYFKSYWQGEQSFTVVITPISRFVFGDWSRVLYERLSIDALNPIESAKLVGGRYVFTDRMQSELMLLTILNNELAVYVSSRGVSEDELNAFMTTWLQRIPPEPWDTEAQLPTYAGETIGCRQLLREKQTADALTQCIVEASAGDAALEVVIAGLYAEQGPDAFADVYQWYAKVADRGESEHFAYQLLDLASANKQSLKVISQDIESKRGIALWLYGEMIRTREIGPLNGMSAHEAYLASAQAGLPIGMHYVGLSFLQGDDGVERNDTIAWDWIRRAAEADHSVAQEWYAERLLHDGESSNDFTAFEFFQAAAKQHSSYSQYNIGVIYHQGDVVDQDVELASYWLDRAAQQDDEYALKYLASHPELRR